MVVSIHQPEHLPWMGLIHKISVSDTHIALDNVQFKKNYFENRNKIYTHQGWKWLTLPVQMRGHIEKKFYEMELMSGWKKKYLETLKITYKKAPFYKDIESIVQLIQDYEGFNLAEINLNIIEEICKKLDIHTRILRAKDMHVSGKKTELLIEILLNVKATSYLVGNSGFDYMDLSLFKTTILA